MNDGALIAGVVILTAASVCIGGVFLVRSYIDRAKTAEARVGLRQIQALAGRAYERDHRVCPSSAPVPLEGSSIRGQFYQSTARDWHDDPGWSCLGFEMTGPQYFRYEYIATDTGYVARASGDLNGDGKFSRLELHGQLLGGALVGGKLTTRDLAE